MDIKYGYSWAYFYSYFKVLIIDSWTTIMNKFIILIEIHVIKFIFSLTVIYAHLMF